MAKEYSRMRSSIPKYNYTEFIGIFTSDHILPGILLALMTLLDQMAEIHVRLGILAVSDGFGIFQYT